MTNCTRLICFDSDSFPLIIRDMKDHLLADLYKIGWQTEVYIFCDESTHDVTENDFQFELNLN